MKNARKARSYGLYRHLRTSKEIIENLLNYCPNLSIEYVPIMYLLKSRYVALLKLYKNSVIAFRLLSYHIFPCLSIPFCKPHSE